MKQTYRALKAFSHENSYCDKGALVEMTAKQAEFLLAGGYIIAAERPAATEADIAAPETKTDKPAKKVIK